jgi:hypothetical protein
MRKKKINRRKRVKWNKIMRYGDLMCYPGSGSVIRCEVCLGRAGDTKKKAK